MKGKPTSLEIGQNLDAVSRIAAEIFVAGARESQKFSAALSGGSTPKRLYELLASPEFADRIPWEKVHFFWGDERCVPPDHPESNYKMANDLLISKVKLPQRNIHRMKGELKPEEAAAEYEKDLRAFFGSEPFFDLILLGIGTDGHTASLFPHEPVLRESQKWTAGYFVKKLNMNRLTLTPPALNAGKRVVFLVSGKEKAAVLDQIINGPLDPERLPAQLVRPASGKLIWLVDRPAAEGR